MDYDRFSYRNFEHTERYHRIVNRATFAAIYILVGGLLVDTLSVWWAMLLPAAFMLVAFMAGYLILLAIYLMILLAEKVHDWFLGV